MKISRKQALKGVVAGMVGGFTLPAFGFDSKHTLAGNVNHSVCQWCYGTISIPDLCAAAYAMGLKSVELLRSNEWQIAIDHKLTCAMGYGTSVFLTKGFNDPSLHEQMQKEFAEAIPKAADLGIKKLICFSGNRNGISDETGWENCAKGLEPVVKLAQKYDIIIAMELLNSKVNHKDYQCDHTTWGVKLVDKVGMENFKLLYDIYHMQIMEGDVIATIQKYHTYFSHYHTGGVPGRHEIDETQELYYPAIIKAILETGYTGYIGQEFVPAGPNPLASLEAAVKICDV